MKCLEPKASEEPSIVLDTSDTLSSEEAESGRSPAAEVEMDSEDISPERLAEKKRALGPFEKAIYALLGNESDEYLRRFAKKSTFNVYGFFLGPFWYAHRGMLKLAILDTVFIYLSCVMFILHHTTKSICFCAICGSFSLILRFSGDVFYKHHINTKAQELAQLVPDSAEWQKYIVRNTRKSGTFIVILLLLVALTALTLGWFFFGLVGALAKV